MISTKNYWCENELTTIRNRLEYKLLYIANKTTLQDVKEYLSYFEKNRVDRKIKEYIDNGYLKIATNIDKLSFLTVDELKNILKVNSLKISGKKEELIDRIKSNVQENQYIAYLPIGEYITRTDRGNIRYTELLNAKDVVFYETFEKIAEFICKSDYHSAERLSKNFYKANHFKSKDVDLGFQLHNAYLPELKKRFTNEYDKHTYSAVVANDFLGGTIDINIINNYIKKYKNVEFNNQTWHNIQAYYYNLRNLYLYKKENVKYYSISTAHDNKTCKYCNDMNRKVFKIHDAVKGVNFPPFCQYCRCTILPVDTKSNKINYVGISHNTMKKTVLMCKLIAFFYFLLFVV